MLSSNTPCSEALDLWLSDCILADPADMVPGRYLKETTETSYRQYVDSLKLFFADMPLEKIHAGNLREYQRARLLGHEPFLRYRRPQDAKERIIDGVKHPPKGKTPCPVKPKKVNQELQVLKRVMQTAGAWTMEINKRYHRLAEEESEVQRALEPEEQELWLGTAASRPEWKVVHWYSLLAIGCTLSTNELRYLRLGDINLHHQTITVAGKGVKCRGKHKPARRRVIALVGADQLWAAEKLLERAKEECGCRDPQHYVFPMRNRKFDFDPTTPMSNSGIKREWQEIRDETGLTWFRQYDCRHTGGTNLATEGWRPAQIKARMGHITDEMMDHYTHISESAQRREFNRVRESRLKRPAQPAPRHWETDDFERRVAYR